MAENSQIEWTDHTFNPWIGCTKVSPGCANCYAETLMDTRYGRVAWGDRGTRRLTSDDTWRLPLRWNNQIWRQCRPCGNRWHGDGYCPACGKNECDIVRARVFCASLADVFEDWTFPMLDHKGDLSSGTMADWRMRLFALICATPNLDWLLLTKRPENALRFFTDHTPSDIFVAGQDWAREVQPAGGKKQTLAGLIAATQRIGENVEKKSPFARFTMPHTWPLPNLWMGTTVENQEMADKRIPLLLQIPAKVRFLSCEPLLSEVRLFGLNETLPYELAATGRAWSESNVEYERLFKSGIHWVICGGESGPSARPMNPDWAVSLRRQCEASDIPFFFKQWGEWVGGHLDNRKGKVVLQDGRIFWTNPGHPELFHWNQTAPGGHAWLRTVSAKVGKKPRLLEKMYDGPEKFTNNGLLDHREMKAFPEVTP